MGDECGGNFEYSKSGVKKCSGCLVPHSDSGYEHIVSKILLINEKMKKRGKGND